MDINEKAEEVKTVMFDCLDSVDIDKIVSDGLTIRVGHKVLKLSVVSQSMIPEVDEIKSEFREKLNTQQRAIKQKINEKINEITEYHHSMKIEYKRKEQELKDILARSAPMPDILYRHAQNGLSVAKGENKNELVWLVQGVYWPKTYDHVQIDPKFSKKMISNVVYLINTKDNRVTGVSTRKPIGLDYFSHYHQSRPDCWGKWKNKPSWSTPDDIIKIAREAEAVLENINSGSIAEQNPRGLPRHNTLKRHLVDKKDSARMGALNQTTKRTGITEEVRSEDRDVWSL
jgi:hypothetical protein